MKFSLVLALVLVSPLAAAAQDDSYQDARARDLVRLARERRTLEDRRIQRYRTTAVERMSAGLNMGIGEKLLYRRETVTQIDWTRDTVRLHVIGAREVMPPVKGAPQIPAGLDGYVPALAFDPVDSEMLMRFDSTVIRHPLAEGSEQYYRFSSGDTTVIRLPDGRIVRLRELRFSPRHRDPHEINGAFWLEQESHAVVQVYFRLAAPLKPDEGDDGPPFLRPVRAELDYIAIDYGLWDFRWWLPRMVSARGTMQAGAIRMPMSFERKYSDYEITGDTLARPPLAGEAPKMETRPCRPRIQSGVTIRIGGSPDTVRTRTADNMERRQQVRDSIRTARRNGVPDTTGAPTDTTTVCDRTFIITAAEDSVLLHSELLPASIYADGESIFSESAMQDIVDRVRSLPLPDLPFGGPTLELPGRGPGLVRYNRVEGLALGARLIQDLGPYSAEAELMVATAAPALYGSILAQQRGARFEIGAGAYRRLDVVDISVQPFSVSASAVALIGGRDDNDYFRATGAELTLRPATTQSQWYDVRLFAEAQRSVSKETDFSVAHLLDDDRSFRPNISSTRANQAGATVHLRTSKGLNPDAFRWSTELELHGEAGDFTFTRPSLTVRAGMPLGWFALGVEGAAGSSFGDAPSQRRWQLGGATTIRGYSAVAVSGESFWRGRAELGTGLPLLRLSLFGDAGWAGPRADFSTGKPIRSAGVGLGIFDGLVRVDLARALDGPRAWRVHLQLNGVL